MRNALFLFFLFCANLCFAQNQIEFATDKCPDGKRRFYNVVNRGTLLHVKCKNYAGGNLFVLLESRDSKKGILLNPNTLEEGHPKMKVRSVGPDFFIVNVGGKPYVYKFNFKANTWTRLERLETGQSASQRE